MLWGPVDQRFGPTPARSSGDSPHSTDRDYPETWSSNARPPAFPSLRLRPPRRLALHRSGTTGRNCMSRLRCLAPAVAAATTATAVAAAQTATTGNGAPSGSHYNLNIIG